MFKEVGILEILQEVMFEGLLLLILLIFYVLKSKNSISECKYKEETGRLGHSGLENKETVGLYDESIAKDNDVWVDEKKLIRRMILVFATLILVLIYATLTLTEHFWVIPVIALPFTGTITYWIMKIASYRQVSNSKIGISEGKFYYCISPNTFLGNKIRAVTFELSEVLEAIEETKYYRVRGKGRRIEGDKVGKKDKVYTLRVYKCYTNPELMKEVMMGIY